MSSKLPGYWPRVTSDEMKGSQRRRGQDVSLHSSPLLPLPSFLIFFSFYFFFSLTRKVGKRFPQDSSLSSFSPFFSLFLFLFLQTFFSSHCPTCRVHNVYFLCEYSSNFSPPFSAIDRLKKSLIQNIYHEIFSARQQNWIEKWVSLHSFWEWREGSKNLKSERNRDTERREKSREWKETFDTYNVRTRTERASGKVKRCFLGRAFFQFPFSPLLFLISFSSFFLPIFSPIDTIEFSVNKN